ncbi:MAG: hypothetical protein ACD_19C00176G0076 [uncultured bacterium]|nr:MAG: hypothetical protein ACD_19C00176G0076 [uncultured bacterium]
MSSNGGVRIVLFTMTNFISIFMIIPIIFFVLLFVYSKWGPSLPISVLTQTKGEPMGIGYQQVMKSK